MVRRKESHCAESRMGNEVLEGSTDKYMGRSGKNRRGYEELYEEGKKEK